MFLLCYRFVAHPCGDAIQNRVDQPAKTRSTLGAAYALHGPLRRNGERLLVNAILTDARSVIQMEQWKAEYPLNQIKDVPVALAGFVTATLHLPAVAVAATVNAAAYQDYVPGTALARRNPMLDQAIAYARLPR